MTQKTLAIAVVAVLAGGIALSAALGWWNAPVTRRGEGGGTGRGGVGRGAVEGRAVTTESAEEHDPTDRVVRGTTTFADLASWGVAAAEVAKLTGGATGAPDATIREWCGAKGIGFGTVKARIQALVDAAAP